MNRNDQNFIAQKIRSQYMEKESSELDEVGKADFAAVNSESNAQREEAKVIFNPEAHIKMLRERRAEQIKAASERAETAQERIVCAKSR